MDFVQGYIYATISTGILSLLNHTKLWENDVGWIIAPVIGYVFISIVISVTKEITKTKG